MNRICLKKRQRGNAMTHNGTAVEVVNVTRRSYPANGPVSLAGKLSR